MQTEGKNRGGLGTRLHGYAADRKLEHCAAIIVREKSKKSFQTLLSNSKGGALLLECCCTLGGLPSGVRIGVDNCIWTLEWVSEYS